MVKNKINFYLFNTLIRQITLSAISETFPNEVFYTISDMKQNLGIVICLDEEQDNLAELLNSYPLLYNASLLCWCAHWSDTTLTETPALIAQRYSLLHHCELTRTHTHCTYNRLQVEYFSALHLLIYYICVIYYEL